MFEFVYWLRAIAATMITNSHFADIWPISALAFGGHFGNCIYFFLSGFLLFNIRDSFPKWYAKRLIRIYPAVLIASTINILPTFTSDYGIMAYVHCFLYPTRYHFVASILLLYIFFYFFRYIQERLCFNTLWAVFVIFVVYILVYVFAFDKSYYHIDDVTENWCRFMFSASMLLGAHARKNYERISSKIKLYNVLIFVIFTVLYFVVKLSLKNIPEMSIWQFILPIIVCIYIADVSVIFIKLEKSGVLSKLKKYFGKAINFVASISFEIYLIQNPLIIFFSKMTFPLRLLLVVFSILIYAFLVHKLAATVQKFLLKLPVFRTEKKEVCK